MKRKKYSSYGAVTQEMTISNMLAESVVGFGFVHPRTHPTRGELYACLGIVKVPANNPYNASFYEYSSIDCGRELVRNLRLNRRFEIEDDYTEHSVGAALKRLLADVRALHQPRDG
ncbi:hypothetical protein [Sorangium sp. So ce1078]|uniref:hypothetical protein n=1 Tax=Sorangium sp. So ce1078 TaxID=3133329 RepID=UPI003F6437EC